MPPAPTISSNGGRALQPATPVASLPPYSGAVVDFHRPFSGLVSNGQPLSSGCYGKRGGNLHYASGSSSCRHCAILVLQTLTNRIPAHGPPDLYPYSYPMETQYLSADGFSTPPTVSENPSWPNLPSTAIPAYGSASEVSGCHIPAAVSTSSTMSHGYWGQQAQSQLPTDPISNSGMEDLAAILWSETWHPV
jgi:hypothetical protein